MFGLLLFQREKTGNGPGNLGGSVAFLPAYDTLIILRRMKAVVSVERRDGVGSVPMDNNAEQIIP